MRMTLKVMLVAALAVILMQMAIRPVALFGKHDGEGAQDLKLQGPWNVTLRFPVCNAFCTCPGGVPNIPIPSLNTYLKDSTLLVALGGSLFAGPGHGSWERIGYNNFRARFKFFLFNPDGSRRGSKPVRRSISSTLRGTSQRMDAPSTKLRHVLNR